MTWLIFWAIGLTLSTALGAYVVKNHRDVGLAVLMVFDATWIVCGNILVPRVAELNMGLAIMTLTSGSIIWGYTAQLEDMINEIYGKRKTYLAIIMSYVANLTWVSFVYVAASAPAIWDPAKETFWREMFVSAAPRVLIASAISYFTTGFIDATLFAWLKSLFAKAEEKSHLPKFLTLVSVRSTVTDILNQALDPWIFLTLAFWGVLPPEKIVALASSTMVAKIVLVTIDFPWFAWYKAMTRNVVRDF